MFTGDRSGDFLYAGLWRTGFANQPTAVHRHDGLTLDGAWITAAVRCAPPANKPAPDERDRCRPFLERELALDDGRAIVCSYHVSQQNTFTGKLTEAMFDGVLRRARKLAGL